VNEVDKHGLKKVEIFQLPRRT